LAWRLYRDYRGEGWKAPSRRERRRTGLLAETLLFGRTLLLARAVIPRCGSRQDGVLQSLQARRT
jgi:hypothetical protein